MSKKTHKKSKSQAKKSQSVRRRSGQIKEGIAKNAYKSKRKYKSYIPQDLKK